MEHEGSNEFYEHSAREVTELLESAAHETIWRTSFRMFEILQSRHPEIAKRNPFLRDFQRFVVPLVGVTTQRLFQKSQIADIITGGERFEEGEEHPIFYRDATLAGLDKKVGLFIELSLYELLEAGWNFDDALLILTGECREQRLITREMQLAEAYTPEMLPYYRIPKDDGKTSSRDPKVLVAH